MKASVFQIIDLDRTLFDTSQFTKLLTEEVNKVSPGMGTELDAQFEAAYKREETFFLLRHLREQKGDAWFEQLVARVVDTYGSERFMLPGAAERISLASSLGDARPAWGILTYGDAVDQHMKLRIAKLEDTPVLITDTPDKGTIIASWRLVDGRYQLPSEFGGQIVDTITFEDDKLRAFRDMPEDAVGIWITNDETALDRIAEEGLKNVTPAQDLFASMEVLKSLKIGTPR